MLSPINNHTPEVSENQDYGAIFIFFRIIPVTKGYKGNMQKQS